MFLKKAWGIRNAYKHDTPVVDVLLSPPLRGAGPMALMLGHEWQHARNIYVHYVAWGTRCVFVRLTYVVNCVICML
jgi:hypothetical protein